MPLSREHMPNYVLGEKFNNFQAMKHFYRLTNSHSFPRAALITLLISPKITHLL